MKFLANKERAEKRLPGKLVKSSDGIGVTDLGKETSNRGSSSPPFPRFRRASELSSKVEANEDIEEGGGEEGEEEGETPSSRFFSLDRIMSL